MPTTTSGRMELPIPVASDVDDMPAILQALAEAIRDQATRWLPPGTLGSRPAASISGRLYLATDNGHVYLDVGSDWLDLTAIGPTDHGALTGLGDDDHAQYHNDARGDARYARLIGAAFAGAVTAVGLDTTGAGQVKEQGTRVYSPNNPPPASGMTIKQIIRGTVTLPSGTHVTTASIPTVVMAKAEVRFLGFRGSHSFQNSWGWDPPHLRLATATTVEVQRSGTNGPADAHISYEITEYN